MMESVDWSAWELRSITTTGLFVLGLENALGGWSNGLKGGGVWLSVAVQPIGVLPGEVGNLGGMLSFA